jgi:thioredoxin reductase (NADPH)
VYLVHRRGELRASKIMADRVLSNPKIEPVWDSVVEDILDVKQNQVTGVVLRNLKTNTTKELPAVGVFVAIGHVQSTEIFKGQIEMDPDGYILCKKGTYTSVPGVFSAGDCVDRTYRQAITAAGTGCAAAIDAERFLGHA